MPQFEASLTDDRNVFMIQATGGDAVPKLKQDQEGYWVNTSKDRMT